jgi:hypothetical protein
VSFAAVTLCVASQQVFIVASVYFVIDSVRKHLDTTRMVRGNISNIRCTHGDRCKRYEALRKVILMEIEGHVAKA